MRIYSRRMVHSSPSHLITVHQCQHLSCNNKKTNKQTIKQLTASPSVSATISIIIYFSNPFRFYSSYCLPNMCQQYLVNMFFHTCLPNHKTQNMSHGIYRYWYIFVFILEHCLYQPILVHFYVPLYRTILE